MDTGYTQLKDFKTAVVQGTTNASPNTSRIFYHNKGAIPQHVSIAEGNVYIQSGSSGMKSIDVRSNLASQAFKIILFF